MKFKRIVAAICAAAMAFSPVGVNVMSFAETSAVEMVTVETENDGNDDRNDSSDSSENDENDDRNDETASNTSDNDVAEETTGEGNAVESVNAEVSVYELNDGSGSNNYNTWSEVLAAMNDSTKDYTITLLDDTTEGEITFPDATKAKSVTVEGGSNTLTIANASLTLLTDVAFTNITLETTSTSGLTITANKSLSVLQLTSKTLKKVSGGSGSVLRVRVDGEFPNIEYVNYEISGIGTVEINYEVKFTNTVNAGKLVYGTNATICVGSNAVTFTSIEAENVGFICYTTEDFTPVTVSGDVTANDFIGLQWIDDCADVKFANGATVLIAEKADLSKFFVCGSSRPTEDCELVRVGSEVKIMSAAYELSDGGDSTVKYSSWAEAVAAMNDSTKDYTITLLADVTEGNITFPTAKQAKSVTVEGKWHTLTIDNAALTLPTDVTFKNLVLQTTNETGFTITANKNICANFLNSSDLNLKAVKGSSNSVFEVDDRYVNYDVSGFGTIAVRTGADFNEGGETTTTVSATNLVLGNEEYAAEIVVGNCNATFTNIIVKCPDKNGEIDYEDAANIHPVTINGTVTAAKPIIIYADNGTFKSGDTVLISKTADLSKFELDKYSLPDNGVEYTLAREGSEVKIKGAVFELSNGAGDPVKYSSWSDVLAAINDKTKDYTITLLSDVTEGKITFPAATKAKSVTVEGINHKFTIANTALTLLTDVAFTNITLESSDKTKGLTITASKNFVDGGITSETLKTVKGNSKSVLTFDLGDGKPITYSISGFGTVAVVGMPVGFNGGGETAATVSAANLELGTSDWSTGIILGNCNAKFTNVKALSSERSCKISYADAEDFTPVTITGTVTAEKPIIISANNKFKNGDTVLISKTADLSKFVIDENCLPDDGKTYTLARVGSEVKVMEAAFEVTIGSGEPVKFAQWSDILNTIAVNAKADKNAAKTTNYIVKLLGDVNIGKITMPKAGTFGTLRITGGSEDAKALTFVGNTVSLTGDTYFHNLILKAEKTAGSGNYVDLSISAGKNFLEIKNVTGKLKDIKSTGTVALGGTTINGAASANELYINNGTEPTDPNSLAALDSFVGVPAPDTSVTVNGNLTVKNMLTLYSSLTVKGAFSAAGITSEASADDVALVLYQNTKKPAAIGKLGFDKQSRQIKFALVDPTTAKTVQIVEDTVIAAIGGTYANNLVPCDENLDSEESYYIIKENGKLVAKPQDAVNNDYITVLINGKTAYYKDLDAAIKDINASGKATDAVEIKITQSMFPETVAKLPLPNAGKYAKLTYKADAPVTINVTSDITLTGDLTIYPNITINKVDKNGTVLPMSVNVGRYTMALGGYLSPKTDDEQTVSRIANISGAGTFYTETNIVVTGKINVGILDLIDSAVTLEGTKSSFAGSVYCSGTCTLVYDKANAKNVKFGDINGNSLTVKINGEVEEGDAIAAITGDYIKGCVKIDGSELVAVRSDKNITAVKADSIITVTEVGNIKRAYDTLENAMKDINRLNHKDAKYSVDVTNANGKTYSKLPLPAAGKYAKLDYTPQEPVTINVTSDITLTGDCVTDSNLTINKVGKDGKVVEMSVNIGSYDLNCKGKLSYTDTETNSVSRLKNISGKGKFEIWCDAAVSGKVNVGTAAWKGTLTLGEKAAFAANVQTGVNNATPHLEYHAVVGKNVKLGTITKYGSTKRGLLHVNISDVKAGDQIAALTGDYIAGAVGINGGSEFTAVRSGTKLIAVEEQTEVTVSDGTNIRYYDTYANAIADITRLKNPNGEYVITIPEGTNGITKLALPAKGKYKSIEIKAAAAVTIELKSDVSLTGDLIIGENVTLKKANDAALKFTSAKNKDGSPVYTVKTKDGGKIVNGTLNGEKIFEIEGGEGELDE